MKSKLFVTAVALAAAPLVTAPLTSAQTGGATAPQTATGMKGDQAITVTGCVQRESEYRKAQDKGRGGVVGTGVGVDNEFVLTNMSAEGAEAAKVKIAADTAYELTGANEKMAGPHVGHRVQITGTLKAAEVTAGGRATGGATAGTPPTGVDVASKDLQLRELEVTAVKMLSANCTAK